MPIKIPNDLPAAATLQSENIFVMPETRAITQDIRPLEILILNLMPTKIVTETQFARLLGNTPLQVHLEFLHTRSHVATHVSAEHLFTFYKTFDEVRDRRYDGMIITGAPVEQLPFEDVRVLAGALQHHGLEPDACAQHAAHLLGRAGRAVPSLRHREGAAGEKALRRVPAPRGI